MRKPKIHVVGAGLAGLAAALRLVESRLGTRHDVIVHEAAGQAGGRCRSYYEPTLGLTIDNGNHLLLSGNWAVKSFLKSVGNENGLEGPSEARFPFVDLKTGQSWVLHPNEGPFPWWILMKDRRVPGTSAADYLELMKLVRLKEDRPLKEVIRCQGRLYERLWQPFFLAALNTGPEDGSALLAAAITRETLMKGGRHCHPLVASKGLSEAFIDPALATLEKQGAQIRFQHRLRRLVLNEREVTALEFDGETIPLEPGDRLVLAVPSWVAESLLPGLAVPQTYRAIVNAHFKIAPPAGSPPILGVVNGLVEWLFAYPDRLSVTISGADRLLDVGRETLAEQIWADVTKLTQIAAPLPPWQIIKEKRATFAATCDEERRRPGARTRFANLSLAGDWTATGLPATIEGAIRSGYRAADDCESRA